MPTPAADSWAIGKNGVVALVSPAGTPVQYNFPVFNFAAPIRRGDSGINTVNNFAWPNNRVKGVDWAEISLGMPFIGGTVNATFLNECVLTNVVGDTTASNYWTITRWPNNVSETPQVYSNVKFGTLGGSVSFATRGSSAMVSLSLSGISTNPLYGTAATAPTAQTPLASSGITSFAQVTFNSTASEVSDISWNFDVGLSMPRALTTAGNSNFNAVPVGTVQTGGTSIDGLCGTISVTQSYYAATVIGDNGNEGTLTIELGTTGAGVKLQFNVMPLGLVSPQTNDYLTATRTYGIIAAGSTAPLIITDL